MIYVDICKKIRIRVQIREDGAYLIQYPTYVAEVHAWIEIMKKYLLEKVP